MGLKPGLSQRGIAQVLDRAGQSLSIIGFQRKSVVPVVHFNFIPSHSLYATGEHLITTYHSRLWKRGLRGHRGVGGFQLFICENRHLGPKRLRTR